MNDHSSGQIQVCWHWDFSTEITSSLAMTNVKISFCNPILTMKYLVGVRTIREMEEMKKNEKVLWKGAPFLKIP